MPNKGTFLKTFKSRVLVIGVAVFVSAAGLMVANFLIMQSIKDLPTRINYIALGRTYVSQFAFFTKELSDPRSTLPNGRPRLREIMADMDRRFQILLDGDAGMDVPPIENPESRVELLDNQRIWTSETRPLLAEFVSLDAVEDRAAKYGAVLDSLRKLSVETRESVDVQQKALRETISRYMSIQIGLFSGIVVVLLIAAGIMHRMIANIGRTTNTLASASAELLAGSSQQASSAQEQAAAVAETVSTVDEVLQTSEQAAQRAKGVAESAQRAVEIGKTGKVAVDESVAQMAILQEQTASIAESILALSERTQAISEIIASVTDIADQTNLLALNAGIEAARAGEHGAGFNVVAREIKDLADQAKKATAQVRQILGDIQKATNSAVMATEEGGKSVDAMIVTVGRAGETIRSLIGTIEEAAIAASQITASAAQQATGMAQVHQAMRDINEATTQTSVATRQAERAAQDLNVLGRQLRETIGA